MRSGASKSSELKVKFYRGPQTWYGQLAFTLSIALLLWMAVMFFTVLLVVIGLVFTVMIIPLSWVFIKEKKGQSSSFIKTEYSVKNTRQTEQKDTKQINKKDSK